MKRFAFIAIVCCAFFIISCNKPVEPTGNDVTELRVPTPSPTSNIEIVDANGTTYNLGVTDREIRKGVNLSDRIKEIIQNSRNHHQFRQKLLDLLFKLVRRGKITSAEAELIWNALKNADIP